MRKTRTGVKGATVVFGGLASKVAHHLGNESPHSQDVSGDKSRHSGWVFAQMCTHR